MTTRSLRPAAMRRIPNLDGRGFTIVEILTVVGIIAVLMGRAFMDLVMMDSCVFGSTASCSSAIVSY